LRPIDEQLSRPGGLAERLYMLRKGAGIPVGELAVRLGWQPSKVTKLQRGQQRPTVADIEKWANACGQPGAASELLDLLSEADAVHWRWPIANMPQPRKTWGARNGRLSVTAACR